MKFHLVALGCLAIVAQVILLRELTVAFYGIELITILAMGNWLTWTGVGALIGRRARGGEDAAIRISFLALALLIPASLIFTRGVRRLFGAMPGAYLSFPRQLVAMSLVLLPVGLLLGFLFRLVARRFMAQGASLPRAYALESLGALAGGVLVTLCFAWRVPNFVVALLAGLVAAGIAAWPASLPGPRGAGRRSPRWFGAALTAVTVVLIMELACATTLDRLFARWNHPMAVAAADTPYARITVDRNDGQLSLFENDALAYESQGTAAAQFVHLAATQVAAPDSVLILGGGMEGLVEEALLHHPAHLDYVELDRGLLDVVTPLVDDSSRAALAAPQVRVVIADPRRFLRSAPRYDLILVGMPEPESGAANRFFTREFFAECAARLRPGGVVALRLHSGENYWTPELLHRTASVYRALRAVFSHVVVLPGATNFALASAAPLSDDPALLAARLEARGIHDPMVSAAYIRYLYTNDRFQEVARLLGGAEVPANTDSRPVCYSYALLLWLSRFMPVRALSHALELTPGQAAHSGAAWIAIFAGIAVIITTARRRSSRRAGFVALAGFMGMVVETVLLLGYQERSGALYQDLGLLLTAFMAGLALGAWMGERMTGSSRARTKAGAVRGEGRWRAGGRSLTFCPHLLAFAILGLLIAWFVRAPGASALGPGADLAASAALLVAAGFLVAAVFALAALDPDARPDTLVSPLYAADLLGGAVGSLAASLVLIPILGLCGSALSMVALAVVAGGIGFVLPARA